MSEENVEIVRRVYERWARGDFSNVDDFDPDIEFEMADWPHQTKVTGIEAMWETWRSTLGAFEGFRSMATEFTAVGDNVLVLNRIEASGKESGAGVGADVASLFTLRNGKVTRLALYWDVDAARREAIAQG
ncbi:MAG: nuclear transport factor 2 family protein [Thermoleophilaceae bacterium]|jgi:ketosteroid isomerase-like protein